MGGCNLKNPQREVAAPAAPTAPPLPPPVAEKEEELPAPAPAPAPGPAPAPAPGPAPAPVPQPIGVTSDNEEDLEEDFDDYGGGGGGDDDAPSATRPTHTPLKAWEMEFFLAGITPKNTAEAEAEPAVALPPTTKHTDGDFHSCSHCFRGSISPEQAVQGAGSVIQQVSYLMTSAFHATVPEVCAQAIVEVSMTPVTCDYKCFNTVGLLWSLVKGSGTSFKTSNSLGKAIARNLPASDIIESTSVTDLGFVNIVLSNSWIAKRLQNMLVNGIQSWAPILPVKRVVLDSSSPSIANEMHVGHLRPTIIGDALARMFEFSNVEVLRYNYVGDYDTKFGMLLEFLFEKYPNWEQLGSQAVGNLEDFYKASKQRFDEDAEFKDRAQQVDVQLKRGREEKYSDALKFICETRRNEFDQVYKLLDVQLEEKVEDFYVHHISQVLGQLSREKKLIKEIKGDRVIFIEGYQSPLLLFKRDGSCRYALTELAALSYWLNVEKVEWIIYVTDVGRWQTFDKFFKVARMAGWLPDPKEKKFPKTSHAELGLVLGADGKREGVLLRDLLDKAKTRSKKELIERFTENGKIVDWTDEELERASEALGYGAVKYADLKNDGVTNYTRTLDGMLSDMGNTAVYLQYALAHVCSIIRKSNMDVEELKASGNISLAHQDERDLGLHLIRYAEAVEDGCTKLLPSVVCEYLYKLSRIFTTFCANCPMVVGSPEEASRLMLCEATAIVMRQCFELLGITPVYKL